MALMPKTGETLFGFTAAESQTIHMLGAETLELYHKASGARLLYIKNDDRELGFNLIFRTPQLDGSDSNHILEHLLLCSCPKYPSRDIFFDMDSRSYATFMNGITDNTYTCYPVCTQSENQLIKLIDVFLSCMEAPDAMREKNFFLREGLRFELKEENGPLSMQGTVLNEDWGHLTDIEENADSHMAHALWEGQPAANLLGRAHLHYREITFEKVKKVYEEFYHYSNCLIILYGDLNLNRILEFLDREHLGLRRNTEIPGPQANIKIPGPEPEISAPSPSPGDARSYFNSPAAPGFRELTAQSPAYEGSPAEHASLIDYAIDLSGCTQEELVCWDLLADILDNDSSLWHRFAREEGLNHVMEVYLDSLTAKPALKFRLHNGDEPLKEAFLRSVKKALREIRISGIDPELFHAAMKENRMSDCLTREAAHLGFSLSEEIGRYWSLTGRTDYFSLYETAFRKFLEDGESGSQSIIKKLAASALAPQNHALLVTVPVPGLAEKMESEKERFLQEKKASMTPQELQRLIKETKAFDCWNTQEEVCSSFPDFLISPEELPEPEDVPHINIRTKNGIAFYSCTVPADSIGSFQLCFDISGFPPKDWNYLTLYQMLLTELDTKRFTSLQQKNLEQEYLHDCTFDELYPEECAGINHHPMMSVSWYSLTEDFEKSLDFLLDIMGHSLYDDTAVISRVLDKYLPDYDMSKADTAPSLAYSLAEGYIRRESRFRYLLNNPDIYYFLQDTSRRLKSEAGFKKQLSEKLRETASRILTGHRLVFLAAASPEALPLIEDQALNLLKKLPCAGSASTSELADSLFQQSRRIAACVDSPSQEIRLLGDFRDNGDFKGRYLPFLPALSDRYIKPAIRYRGSAYDSGIDFILPAGYFTLWSTADQDAASTIPVFLNAGKALEELELTDEDLKGYILSTYAQALPPAGMLNSRMRYLRRAMMGIDTKRVNEMISDIKNCSMNDCREAARLIGNMIEKGPIAAVGNEKALTGCRQLFDEVLYIRNQRRHH
ncbi:MAG: insulinase family protein [Enterocloster sp.]